MLPAPPLVSSTANALVRCPWSSRTTARVFAGTTKSLVPRRKPASGWTPSLRRTVANRTGDSSIGGIERGTSCQPPASPKGLLARAACGWRGRLGRPPPRPSHPRGSRVVPSPTGSAARRSPRPAEPRSSRQPQARAPESARSPRCGAPSTRDLSSRSPRAGCLPATGTRSGD